MLLRIFQGLPLRRLRETIQQDTLLSLDTADPVSRGLRLETFQRGGRRGAIDDIVACRQPGKDFQIDIGRVMNQVAIIRRSWVTSFTARKSYSLTFGSRASRRAK